MDNKNLRTVLNNVKPMLNYLKNYDSDPDKNQNNIADLGRSLTPVISTMQDLVGALYMDGGIGSPHTLPSVVVELNKQFSDGQIRDEGLFESACTTISRDGWYCVTDVMNITPMELIHLAYHQMMGIIKNHPFVDGNKRTGVAAYFYIISKVFGRPILPPKDHQLLMVHCLVKDLERDGQSMKIDTRQLWKNATLLALVF